MPTHLIYEVCTQVDPAGSPGNRKEETRMALERWRPFATVERWEPLRNVSDMQDEMNRLFDSFFGRPVSTAAGARAWAPVFDMYETKDELVLNVELPGVREKDISLSI